MVGTWILEENLRQFLAAVSLYAEYDLDGDDWTAVEYGLLRADRAPGEPEIHLDYALSGRRHVELRLSFEPGTGVVSFELRADPDLEARAEAMAFLAATYGLS